MSQVARSAPKVAKQGPRWTHFGPSLLRPAEPFLAFLDAFLQNFKHFSCKIRDFQRNFVSFPESVINFQPKCTVVHENLTEMQKNA